MHGIGNDFIVIDNLFGRIKFSETQIKNLCDRQKGIGADGFILVEPAREDNNDCFMNYYNSDGTQAEMCGNGVRCVAKFLKEYIRNNEGADLLKIETRSGVKEIKRESDGTYSVNMGKPVFASKDFPNKKIEIDGISLDFVSMGNPHAVCFVENLENYDLEKLGPKVENDKNFPNKINFELVREKNKKELDVKVWERGCGVTLACGTGACAVFAAARKFKNADSEIKINLPGGSLFLSENKEGEIIMRGEATFVFDGAFEIV